MTAFILAVLLGIVTGFVADRKGYGLGICILLGAFGLIGLVIALVMPRKAAEASKDQAS